MSQEIWTVTKLLNWSQGYLEKHEIDAPRLTAELLLSHALSCSRVQLYLRFEQPLEAPELAAYKALLKRRIKREPTQYILKKQSFWTMDMYVDPRVLIPRPETECLLEESLNLFKQGSLELKGPFLDLCTGSGAIACALATEFPEAEIDATDLSADALEVARQNATTHELDDRIRFFEGDLFEPLPEREYALILSNPPYITSDEMGGLQPEVQEYEPELALHGGGDGLDIVGRILEQAPAFLRDGGFLLIEIGAEQGEQAMALASQGEAFSQIKILPDYSRRDRILLCGK